MQTWLEYQCSCVARTLQKLTDFSNSGAAKFTTLQIAYWAEVHRWLRSQIIVSQEGETDGQ